MDDRTYLLGLESVKWGVHPLLVAAILIGVPAVLATFPAGSTSGYALYFCALLMIALLVVIVPLAAIHKGTQWETNSDGIIVRGFFGRGFLRWSDVQEVRIRHNPLTGGPCCYLSSQSVTIPIRFEDPRFVASVWQHLTRHGHQDGLAIPPEAARYFAPLPDDIPAEVTWENPRRIRVWAYRIGLGLLYGSWSVAMIWWVWTRNTHSCGDALIAYPALYGPVLLIQWCRRPLLTARRITVMPDRLIAEVGTRSRSIAWGDIRSAIWAKNRIEITARRTVLYIPWRLDDPASNKLVLALIRRLRSEPRPVQLPLPAGLVTTPAARPA